MRALPALLLALGAAGTVASCGEDAPQPAPAPAPRSDTPLAQVRIVEREDATLLLWVSNQSFRDATVVLRVSIDGTTVADRTFDVEGQHNWVLFPVAASPGRHRLEVVSDTGVELTRRFTLPQEGKRHAVVDYWNEPDAGGRHLTWLIQDGPIGFA